VVARSGAVHAQRRKSTRNGYFLLRAQRFNPALLKNTLPALMNRLNFDINQRVKVQLASVRRCKKFFLQERLAIFVIALNRFERIRE